MSGLLITLAQTAAEAELPLPAPTASRPSQPVSDGESWESKIKD